MAVKDAAMGNEEEAAGGNVQKVGIEAPKTARTKKSEHMK